MPAAKGPRPHVKIAYTLVLLGMSLFMLERFGMSWLSGPNHAPVALDGTVLSIMALAPVGLIVAGCLIFAVGAMVRPR